jgi:hypothetical protein
MLRSMTRAKTIWIVLGVLAVAAVIAFLVYRAAQPVDPTRVDSATLARFKAMAETSCRCTATSGDQTGCWADFDKATAPFQPSETHLACAEDSGATLCFGAGDRPTCIRINRSGHGACSEKEWRTAPVDEGAAGAGC